MNISQEVEKIQEELVLLRQKFHQYPETALQEKITTRMIREELEKDGIIDELNAKWFGSEK